MSDALKDMLRAALPPQAADWLADATANAAGMDSAALERTLALAGRKAGRGMLDAPFAGWTLADGARTLIMVSRDGAGFRSICRTADVQTLIGLYRGARLLPYDADMDWQMGEGLRTSISAVFEAIAHDNPLPAERFDEHRWNHMVLKALFIGADPARIVGLQARRNPRLAAALTDHIAERRAAGRAVDPTVWRLIEP